MRIREHKGRRKHYVEEFRQGRRGRRKETRRVCGTPGVLVSGIVTLEIDN